ncbi:NADPH:quinone oxidoreductase family protein [Novosphingobium sp. JCM 18896]|nr:NADPH:quinone oxidoreductase family protein [Novosphingobium sp. JCM 18896]MCW1427531.1 NADPH:quinone oxidoreductase family protein [Novosphingobium sp. JCM 18896]
MTQTLPTTMTALLCEEHGPPEALKLRNDAPVPQPGPGEVLIRIHAAGLNFPDSLIIFDKYQFKPALPFAPGGELSGTIAALGEGVSGFAVGDTVSALTNWGAFAEYVVAKAASTTPIPAGVDLDVAAAITLAHGTSHHALKQRANLQPGETLLVLGASGGVGLAAVEIGKAMGARVIAAASTEEKLAIAKAHGADETINYTTSDLKTAVKELAPKGVDVIYDPVGDKLADPAFRTIGWGGRYLVIGFAGGEIPKLPLNLPLIKGASIVGVFWGDFVARTPDLHQQNMAELYAMLTEGRIKPLISARYPLAQGGAAIRAMMDRQVTGKVIVKTGDAA